jgi:hypothetical protein
MRMLRLKLILLFRSFRSDYIKLQELLERFSLIEQFTPYVSGGRAQSEARKQGSGWRDRRNEAISEVTLAVATIAMLAAFAAAVRS